MTTPSASTEATSSASSRTTTPKAFNSGFEALQALYGSAACKAVRFDTQRLSWATTDGNRALRGVRRVLSERLWSAYDYEKAERLQPTPRARQVTTGVRGARGGRNRGSAVHEQLSAVAAMGWAQARAFYAARRVDMEPLAIKLLQDFHERGWKLVGADVPVYDDRAELRVGSAIDLVAARRADGALFFLELKVGGDNYWYKASGRMQRELHTHNVDNSPMNQALMQLLAYRALFMRCYNDIVPVRFVAGWAVVFLGESGVKYKPLTDAMVRTLQPAVIAALVNSEAEAARARATNAANRKKNKK